MERRVEPDRPASSLEHLNVGIFTGRTGDRFRTLAVTDFTLSLTFERFHSTTARTRCVVDVLVIDREPLHGDRSARVLVPLLPSGVSSVRLQEFVSGFTTVRAEPSRVPCSITSESRTGRHSALVAPGHLPPPRRRYSTASASVLGVWSIDIIIHCGGCLPTPIPLQGSTNNLGAVLVTTVSQLEIREKIPYLRRGGCHVSQKARCRSSISARTIERTSRQSAGCEVSSPGVGASGPGWI